MDVDVQQKFNSYPKEVATVMDALRTLIFQVAQQDGITDLIETLKWGEPSYVCKTGSTIRMDWKPKHPTQYCVYFNCKTNLVATFKELYGDIFTYEGNRALVFKLNPIQSDKGIAHKALAHCLSLSLRYKTIKHLPLLGA